ncbi:MAG: hypothetical protein COS89_06960 [Deltaproteobacteria bacterium CG07_land_8_20_14_0_80_38_7]|nr:MAG: hypothetical protein COS89_06960 [Deltaproteobacteria bacterium CG07_land_8_20_14_0_80_38_7]PIY78496.1 MAG: hypothetical protein COY82_02160 [Parcubacteria group bacterium CG_4_10_14_0_8_um_filter_35_7]
MSIILGSGRFDAETIIRGELSAESAGNGRNNFHLLSGKTYIPGQITPHIQNIPQYGCFTEDADRKGITFVATNIPDEGEIVSFDYIEED